MNPQMAYQPLYIPPYGGQPDLVGHPQYHAITTAIPAPMSLSMPPVMSNALQEKARMEPWQSQFLEKIFNERQKPATKEKEKIANMLGFRLEKINNWFQNRRAKEKVEVRKRQNSGTLAMRRQAPRPAAINTQRSASYSAGLSSATAKSPLSPISPGTSAAPLPERSLRHTKSYGAVASGRIQKSSSSSRSPSCLSFADAVSTNSSLMRQSSYSSLSSPTLSGPSMPNTPDVPQVPQMPDWCKQSNNALISPSIPFTPNSDLSSATFPSDPSYLAPWSQLESLHHSQEAAMTSGPPLSAPLHVDAQQQAALAQLQQLRNDSVHQPAPFTAPAMQQEFSFGAFPDHLPEIPSSHHHHHQDNTSYCWTHQLNSLQQSQQSAMLSAAPPMSAPLVVQSAVFAKNAHGQALDQLEALQLSSSAVAVAVEHNAEPVLTTASLPYQTEFSFDLSSPTGLPDATVGPDESQFHFPEFEGYVFKRD